MHVILIAVVLAAIFAVAVLTGNESDASGNAGDIKASAGLVVALLSAAIIIGALMWPILTHIWQVAGTI